MNRRVASKGSAGELGAPVGDHFVDVHIELGAAAGHPDVKREHLVMFSSEDFVADLNDQLKGGVVQPFAGVVCDGGRLFQSRIGGDHLPWNEIMANAEVF